MDRSRSWLAAACALCGDVDRGFVAVHPAEVASDASNNHP